MCICVFAYKIWPETYFVNKKFYILKINSFEDKIQMFEIKINLLSNEWSISCPIFILALEIQRVNTYSSFDSQHCVTNQSYYSVMHEFLWLQIKHYNSVNVKAL